MNVLLISISMPPKRDPESLMVAKYCKYLNLCREVNLDIVTSKNPTLFMDIDSGLIPYSQTLAISKEIKIHESKYLNYLIRKINPAWLQYPDSKYTFWWQWRKMLPKEKPDILYSRSYPMSATVAALKIKKTLNIPWVFHLSDPWAISSSQSLSPSTFYADKARVWNKKLETECIKLADRICLTSEKTIDLYAKAYPEHTGKFCYFPNVYDDANVEKNIYSHKDVLTFLHTGGFGEARSPLVLLNAIEQFWLANRDSIQSKVKFLFTGEMTRRNRAIFNGYAHVPIIEHLGVITYQEVLSKQRQADVLINIDSDIKEAEHAVYFPSKLLDYMIAQRRVIAITNKYSTTFSVVQDKLGECFDFNEAEELAQHFFFIYQQFEMGNENFFETAAPSKEFSAKYNAERLVDLFRQIVTVK